MANKELTALPAAGTLTGTSVLYMVDENNNSRKVSLADLAQYIKTAASIVPASNPRKDARVKRTADLSIANNANLAVTWQAADFDTSAFWNAGAPTRLTVPSGVTKVKLSGGVRWVSNTTGSRLITLFKNGASVAGRFSQQSLTGVIDQSGVSADIPVVAGDYFEMIVFQSSGGALNITASDVTWFQIEVVEGTL